MQKRLLFPIRLKILVTLLSVLTVVVSLITFTMASLFHEDKKAYINDLASMVAMSAAEESRSLLERYQEQLRLYGEVMNRRDLSADRKKDILEGFFENFGDLVSISIHQDGREVSAVYDESQLVQAGLSKDALNRYREENPFPMNRLSAGEGYVENSTLMDALPTLTIAIALPAEKDEPPFVVSGFVRLEKLQRLAARSKAFDLYVADSNGRLLAHSDQALVASRTSARLPAEVRSVFESHGTGMTLEYEENGTQMIGGFASAGLGGVVTVAQVPASSAYLASRELLRRLVFLAFLLLILAAVASLFGSRRITRPLETLSAATREIAQGRFDVEVKARSSDEIGSLAAAFNRMASELKSREAALQSAQSQLIQSEKMAAFGQLGAGIAHEVKNPLAGILSIAQILVRKAEEGTPLHKSLGMIEKETKRCKTIVENLLKFARQEKALLEPIDVNPVIEDAIAISNHQLELNQVKLERVLATDLPQLRGNANQLQQVLMNLMLNAQQAMGGEPGTVRIVTRRSESNGIEIRVADTGPGIPLEIQKKVFDPFFTTKPGGKGTGLGLSVSFGIIHDHGGEISLVSEPGAGATFIISLPAIAGASADANRSTVAEAEVAAV